MTEVSHESFLGRMFNSIVGCVIGLIIFLLAFAVTAWNEGAYVSSQEVIDAAHSAVQEYACDDIQVPKDGKTLVFLHGCSLTGVPNWANTSSGFQLREPVGVWFETVVEMYQWTEESKSQSRKDSVGGGKTTETWYIHHSDWFKDQKNSPTHCDEPNGPHSCTKPETACRNNIFNPDSPAHCNPELPISPVSEKQYAEQRTVKAGTVYLNREQMGQLRTKRPLLPFRTPTSSTPEQAPLPIVQLTPGNSRIDGNTVTTRPINARPRIGDVRVKWYANAAHEASVLAAVDEKGAMVPWHAGVKAKVPGVSTYMNALQEGDVQLATFIAQLRSEIEGQVWGLRLLSLVMFCIGIFLFLNPLSVAPDIIPCIGPAIGDMVGCAIAMISCIGGLCNFLFVTALCWLWFRPLIGITLLIIAAGLALLIVRLRRRATHKRGVNQFPNEVTPTNFLNSNQVSLPGSCVPAYSGYPVGSSACNSYPALPPTELHMGTAVHYGSTCDPPKV